MVRFGLLGVSYNTDILSRDEASSYNAYWNSKVAGKVGHFDWHLPSLGQISLLNGNRDPSPFDIGEDAWQAVQEKTLSLKPQVGGYFDYGGTFSSLKNGEMLAMCGIGDWITGVLQKDGAPVASVIPEEGGIQWTESYSIGKGSTKQEIANKFIQYMLSPGGQVRSIQMAAYPGLSPTKSGWKAIQDANPAEADRSGLIEGHDQSPRKLLAEKRLFFATFHASRRSRTGTTSGRNTRPHSEDKKQMRRRPAAAHRIHAGHGTKTVDLSLCLANAFADLAGAVFRRTLDPDGRDVLLAGAQLPHGTGLRPGELGTHADPGLLLERVSSDVSAGEPCSGTGQPPVVSRLLRACVQGFRNSAPLGNLLPDRALLHFVPCPRIRLAGPAC